MNPILLLPLAWAVALGLHAADVSPPATKTNAAPQPALAAVIPTSPAAAPASGIQIAAAPVPARAATPKATPAPAPASVQASPQPASTPATAAASPPQRNIRFQFDGIPYMDVIERFAQMTGKPLLTDTNVQGTLSFNDPNPYTLEEALDTLNLILSMKRLMLADTGSHLRLIPLKELPSMPHRILRGLDKSGDVRPGEVITVVLDVNNVDSKEIADAVTSMLSNAGSVAPLSRGRGLLITDRLSNIQRIRTLLSNIDTPAVTDRQMKTYTLVHASGGIVADLLNRTFGLATAPKRTQYNPSTKALETLPPDPNDYITAVYDEASRTLVLFGPNERITLAEELINRFEQKDGPGGDVRIYYPQTVKVAELASIIRQAIPGVAAENESGPGANLKARVITDASQNRLIVAAPIPGQLDQIEQLVNRVDKPVHGQGAGSPVAMRSQTVQLTKVFRPRTVEVTNVAVILNQALTRRLPNGGIVTTASVSHDVASQSVVVSGSPNDLQIASDIVTQLETGSSQPTALQTRFIDVGTAAEARRLQPLIEKLYRNQVSDGGAGTVAHAKIIADSESGRLIVTASDDHLAKIEALVKQVRSDRFQNQSRRLQILPLKNVRVESALATVQSLVADRMSDRRFADLPKPSVLADAPNNRLLVTATEAQIAEVQAVVQALDVAPTRVNREMSVIPVQSKSAAELIALATQLLPQLGESTADPQLAPKLMPDATGRQVIILAQASDLERIRALIQRLDSASPSAVRQFKSVTLFARSSAELTPLVQQLYAEQLKGQPEPVGGAATVSQDAKNNRILVSGPDKELDRVEAIVRQLDPEGARSARDETRVVRLKSASAAELVGLIEKSLNAQQRKVSVLVDTRSNSLVVTGDSGSVDAASQIIQQLDSRPDSGPRELRIIDLKSADANALSPMVTGLFVELMKDQRGPDYVSPTRIVPDPAANRIIITGVREELNQVAELVQRLDHSPEQAPGARVFKLSSADAIMLAPVVSNAMVRFDNRGQAIRRVTVSADEKSNSLIVSGARADLQDAASVVERLDGETSGGGRDRVLKIFDVQSADADGLSSLVLKVFAAQYPGRGTSQLTITPEPGGKRLVVMAPASVMVQVQTVIETLDDKPDQAQRSLHPIELVSANAQELLPKVSQIYMDQSQGKTLKPATLYPDPSGTRLMVYGTAEQAAGIRQIVDSFETAQAVPRETKSFDLGRLANVQRLLPLAQRLYRNQVTNNPVAGPADATMISDGKTGKLIVSARADQMKVIQDIVARLQSESDATPASRETRAFEIGTPADVQRLLPLVQQLYQDQWRDRAESDPADAQIVADAPTGRIMATGRPEHLKEIDAILQKLGVGKAQASGRDTRIYDLTSASAGELATTVRTLYTEQAKSRLGTTPADTTIMADPGSNRLIVVGSTNELDAVEGIINKLDKASTRTSGTRVFQLKNASAEQVSTVLSTALVTINPYGTRVPRVSTGADAQKNLVVVAGEPRDLQSAAIIVEQMDSLASSAPREMRIIPLKRGAASDVSSRVRQLYQDRMKGQTGLGAADALILGDNAGSRLLVTASDAHLKIIEEIVGKLQEVNTTTGRQIRILPLEHNSAQAISSILTQLFARQAATQDPTERLVVSPLPDDRSLVIESAGSTFEKIDQLVKSLDTATAENQGVVQSVHLKKGRAEELAEAVSRSIAARGPESRAKRVHITPVSGANSLLLNGPNDAVQDVLKIIRELDTESEGADIEVRIFKLENGNARELQGVLQQLLQNVSHYQARLHPGDRGLPASISIDERANTLIISATSAHFKVVEKVLPSLDRAPERSDRDVQFVWLRKARAGDVVSTLENVFSGRPDAERPMIESDSRNNSLTIIAKRGDMSQIQDLIARLDEQSKDSSIQVRLRTLDRVAAEQMARMLQGIYPQMSHGRLRIVDRIAPGPEGRVAPGAQPQAPPPTTPAPAPGASAPGDTNAIPEVVIAIDKTANSLILSGPARELDNVDRIISDLSFNFLSNESEFRLFHLKDADPVLVARSLMDLLRQEPIQGQGQDSQSPRAGRQQRRINVVADPRTRSIIARARPTDFPLLESLIQQLDSAGQAAQLEFRLVGLTNAPPDKVLPLVQQLVAQHNLLRPGDPLNVSIDPRSRSLLLIARGSVLDQVERMVRSLDTASTASDAGVLILPLKKANAVQLATVLRSMLRPGSTGENTAEARELQEQVRRLKVQGPDGREILLDLSQPIKISSDGQTAGNRVILTSTPNNLKALAAVVAMMDTTAVTEGVDVRLVPLRFADATTVSQTLSSVFAQGRTLATGPAGPGALPEGAKGKAIAGTLNVAVDTRSNTLIVSGQLETLDLASKIIADLDRQLDRFVTEVRLFRLKHASATRLVPMLQSVFAEGPAVPGTEGLNTQITRLRTIKEAQPSQTTSQARARAALSIQADDFSNILIIAARSDTFPLIQDVIDQLDIPAASGLETVRIYPLKHSDPATIQRILNDLFNGSRAAQLRNDDKPVISVDDRTSALVIAGNSKSFAVVEALLQQLDQKLAFDLRDIRVLPLQHADAGIVAPTLQRLMDARVTQRAAMNKGQTDLLKVTILTDPRSNALLIAGSRDSFELVETLARQLDSAAPALSGQIRLIPLKVADARVLASTLSALFEQRYAASRTPDLQRTKPIILADPRSNSLLVTANQEDNGAIEELLKKLDTKPENPSLILTVLALRNNDAATVAQSIEGVFAARLKAQTLPGQAPIPSEQIKLEPDSLNNALIVSASKENLELIQSLLKRLDEEPTIPGGVLETFTLIHADAQRVAATLRSLVDQGLYRPGSRAGAARGGQRREGLAITVDTRSNSLFVSASPENLALVKEVIKRVDNKDFSGAGEVRMYPLKHAKASSLAATLEQYFRARRQAESVGASASERVLPVGIIPDDRTNAILVTGGKDAFEAIDRILQQLDGESVFARLNFRVFPLQRATATKLQGTLQQIFSNRPPKVKGEPVEPITVVADKWANALLIAAAADDMGTAESLIQQLDGEQADTGIAVHFFPLAKADARRVAQTVQGLFRDGAPGTTQSVTVTADERINAIVVSCGENDAKRIAELVHKLDTEQVARVSEIKIFPLHYARAEALSGILNTALNSKPSGLGEQNPNAQSVLQFITRTSQGRDLVTAALKEAVLITPDTRMNSLIVSGPVDYMGLLEQIVTSLDANSPQQAKIKVFTLQNSDARQMAELLMQLFRMTAASSTTGAQRSIQYTLVKTLAGEDGKPGAEESLASATLGSAEQFALTVTIDPRTNSLLVGGTERYVALVTQIVESLDSTPANERKTEVVRLKNSQAQDVAQAVRTFLDQEKQRITQVLGAQGVDTAQRRLEREIAVVAEPISNTLLVSASPLYFDEIKMVIDELDKAQSQVLIQVLLAEITLDSLLDLGMEWSHTGKKGDVTYGVGTDLGVKDQLSRFGGFSTAVTGSDVNFLLRALKDNGRVEVLSRPQIVTADNKPANINIGQRVPLITDSRVTERGDTINSFRYEDVGVNLSVTPKISPDGFVKMEIGTTNSTISSSTVQINTSAIVPIINQRRANTTVSVQSGQTILIGGLIATSDDKRVKKLPVLGDIPYLGALFRTTRVNRDRKELLIMLTPQVLAQAEGAGKFRPIDEVTREQLNRSRIKDEIKRDALQKQLLDPLFPPAASPDKTPPAPKKSNKDEL